MNDNIILSKYKTILMELRLEMLLSEKFKMRTFMIKHKVPSNFQKALYDTELVSKTEGKSEYKWIKGKVTTKMTECFLENYRKVNKEYAVKHKKIIGVTTTKDSLPKKMVDFLTEVYNEIEVNGNSKFQIRKLVSKYKTSDSARKALFDLGIISNFGTTNGREYKWLAGELNQDLFKKFLSKVREINKVQVIKQGINFSKEFTKEKPVKKSSHLVAIGLLLIASTILFRTLKRFR